MLRIIERMEGFPGPDQQMRFPSRAAFFLAFLCFAISLGAQQAPVSPQPPAPAAPNAQPLPATPKDGKGRPIPSFLIVGTVFNEKALSFPGVQVRVRRKGEKKYTETYTNSRGEFAVRVSPGYEYEVLVHAKKYKDQNKSVDSTIDVQQRLSIQLEPMNPPTTGEKS